MQIEKEVRFTASERQWKAALEATIGAKEKTQVLDITCGKYGFDSLAKTGMIFRVRQNKNGIKLEIKRRTNKNSWLEESVKLDSVKQGLNFLHLTELEPYLYINRMREERMYKNLKVVFDEVELLGKFIEIEYQDSSDAEQELAGFLTLIKIKNIPQPLYGDIFKEKIESDKVFKQIFLKKLKTLI